MTPLLIAAALAGAEPQPAQPLSEAAHAIEAGRLEQARIMIGSAIKAGATGDQVERLLADLAFAAGDSPTALARYRALLTKDGSDPLLHERAGIAALRIGDIAAAIALLKRATALNTSSWRAWNALGVTADYQRDWQAADAAYARAAALEPDRAEVVNNMGWSLLVRGDWEQALALFERASALDPKSERIAHNLELARAALSEELPSRRRGESDVDWAARLNDAGLMASVRGDRKRAVAALTRAVEARSQWFERAANNLQTLERAR